jgi:hypothetical protein
MTLAVSRFQGLQPRAKRVAWIMCGAVLVLGRSAVAAPPENADPSLAPWFNSLRMPWTNALCCSMADCRPTEARTNNDHYEVLIEGEWRVVPDDKVLNRTDNPTGRAVVCWTPTAGILCFVKAPDS